MENSAMISGQTPQPFPGQDHDAHIAAHLTLLEMSVLQQVPAVLAALTVHCMQHIALKAREQVEKEVAQLTSAPQRDAEQIQLLTQAGAIDPMVAQAQLQQMAMQPPVQYTPEQIEARVAQVEAEMLADLMPKLTYKGRNGEEQDPLVAIRLQELQIKQMENENKAQIDQAKLALEQMKMRQSAVTDSARLELQEQIADERNEVNRERIDVQRQAMQRRG